MPKNEKNQWDMYSKHEDDFDSWEWGELPHAQNITDLLAGADTIVKRAMKEAARLVIKEIRSGLMSGLSVNENRIVVEFFTFDGYFEMTAFLDDMIDYEIEGVTDVFTRNIGEEYAGPLREIADDLERQAAKIREKLLPQKPE